MLLLVAAVVIVEVVTSAGGREVAGGGGRVQRRCPGVPVGGRRGGVQAILTVVPLATAAATSEPTVLQVR